METYDWYQQIIRPDWAPPAWVFGPVWAVLYALVAVSFGAVLIGFIQKKLPAKVLIPFGLNLVFNFAFSPIQFGLQSNFLAALDILLVLGTMLWAFKAIWPHMRWVVYMNIPYFLWVSFATVLQLTITYLNI